MRGFGEWGRDGRRRLVAGVWLLLGAALLRTGPQVRAQATQPISAHALPNGVEVTAGGVTMRVTALRDDVLRVTAAAHGAALPEDASWAVLAGARSASVVVSPLAESKGETGFRTAAMTVRIGPDLRLRVTDPGGEPLLEEAEPVAWGGADGTRFRVRLQKHDDDHFFGLGDKPGPLDRAGEAFVMWNTDAYGWQESSDPTYHDISFFLNLRAGRATGVLFDNTYRTFFDFGREDVHQYSFGAPDGPVTYYVLAGPEPKHVVESYAWLTGPTPLPPRWALGFQQSRDTYQPASRLMAVARRLRSDRVPADVLYLDIGYQDRNRPFTVDRDRFPHFSETVAELARQRFHLVLITDPHIAKLPDATYTPYNSGTAGDDFVKLADGSVYSGTVWPGASVFPDFTQASSRAWWGTLYAEFAKAGVAGFWNDMNEPAIFNVTSKTVPDDVQHRIDEPGFRRRTATALEIHNVYGMENARATYEGLLKLEPGTRPFVLARASYAGGQRYMVTWTGDNSATWNHLRLTTPQLENLGLSGFALAGADVGGFAGSPPPDLLTKWMEIGAFQPIDRDHSAKTVREHEPWVDGTAALAVRRRFLEERYRLLPYLYTTAEEMSRTGLPIVRPLFLEFPHATDDGHPLDLDAGGEFLFGSRVLVAPTPNPEDVADYEVHLPPGGWYSYWSGAYYDAAKAEANDPVLVTPKIDELPVYVRAGTILPMAPVVESTEDKPVGPLTLRVYAPREGSESVCEGSLYLDDGKSFAYREGKFLRMHFGCEAAADGSLTLHAAAIASGYAPWWHAVRIEAFGWTAKQHTATAGGRPYRLLRERAAWTATVPVRGDSFEVTLR